MRNQLGGDWECPGCNAIYKDSLTTCKTCSGQKPAGVNQHDIGLPQSAVAVAPDTAERTVDLFSSSKSNWGRFVSTFLRKDEGASMRLVNTKILEAVDNRWANLPSKIAGELVSCTDLCGNVIYPCGLSLTPDETHLLVCDPGNDDPRVMVANASNGELLRNLQCSWSILKGPTQVIVVPQTGQVLVLDIDYHHVVVFAGVDDYTMVRRLGEGSGQGPRQLKFPNSLAMLDGDVADAAAPNGPVVVVADTGNNRLALWRVRDGTVVRHIGSVGDLSGQFRQPTAVTVVPAQSTGPVSPGWWWPMRVILACKC